MWETQVQSLGQEDLPGEGNGNLLHHSCLKNFMDRRAWEARDHGIAESHMTDATLLLMKELGAWTVF